MAISDADRELLDLQKSMHVQGHAAGLPSGQAVQVDPEVVATFERRRAAQREAHGQFVANSNIHIGNALAFTPGHRVPLEHAIRFQLWEQGLINRVASPELARAGKVFASDDDYYAANPHLSREVEEAKAAPELHPHALDPRGGAREIDEARQRKPAGGRKTEATKGE